jgi:D-3-phosphoglycerate dehydrogenase
MTVRVACLSPFDEATVRGLFADRHQVHVILAPPPPAQQAVYDACHEAHLVIADKRHRHRIDRRVLENMRNCLLIQQAAVGFETVDHRAAAELGIAVANAAGYNKESVADLTVMMILALLRHAAHGDRLMRAGGWPREELLGRELGALTVGIVGLGNVGSAVAQRLTGFGSRLLYTDPDPSRRFQGCERRPLENLLAEADVVCIHAPLDVDTRGLFDSRGLASMKRGAILINAARGPIVDEAALIDALRSGQLGGAGLDVYESEPLPLDSPLRAMDNVFLSPHAGGNTVEAEARLLDVVGANLRRVLDGEPPLYVVNGVEAMARR